ncbi:MAG: hypothetical protein MUD10_00350 [Candidatus Pacebacteria bacterium]|nr:hypothetical protein [Candidatus Paceibacterota bacterium]
MKPALLVDFDGVLCCDRFWHSLGEGDYGRIDDFVFGNGGAVAYDWMLGKFTSEQICEKIAKGLGMDYAILWDGLMRDCRNMAVAKENLAKIDSLRGGYTAALVTVNMDCFDRFTVPALGLGRYFDHILNSFNEGMLKHGDYKGLIDVALARTGANYSGSIMIDDSENACREFEACGGRALKVEGEKCLGFWLDYLINKNNIL